MESPIDEKKVIDLDPVSLLGHTLSTSLTSVIANRATIEQHHVADRPLLALKDPAHDGGVFFFGAAPDGFDWCLRQAGVFYMEGPLFHLASPHFPY